MSIEARNGLVDGMMPQGIKSPIIDAETNLQSVGSEQTIMILCKNGVLRRANPEMVENKNLVEWGCVSKRIDSLTTQIQGRVLKARYPIGENLIISFGELRVRLGVNVGRRTLYISEQAGLKKLEDARSKIKKNRAVIEIERELGVPFEEFLWDEVRNGMPKDAIARNIGKPPTFVHEWTRNFGIPSLSVSKAVRNSWRDSEIRKRRTQGIIDAWRDPSKKQVRISRIRSTRAKKNSKVA